MVQLLEAWQEIDGDKIAGLLQEATRLAPEGDPILVSDSVFTNVTDLQAILQVSAARHKHLCPRQVLGARIALAGAAVLGLEVPREGKRLLVIVETDGCFADGIEVATGCTVGHRTLRVEDYGKIAATLIDVKHNRALRIAPQLDIRERAYAYTPGETRHYFAQLQGYQRMPTAELLSIQAVTLTTPVEAIVSRPGVRVNCAQCGEEIINEREVSVAGQLLCRSCAGNGYYQITDPNTDLSSVAVDRWLNGWPAGPSATQSPTQRSQPLPNHA